MDIKVHCLTILYNLLLLHIYIFICEDLGKNLINQDIVDLKCITFKVWINSIQYFLSHLDIQLFFSYAGFDDHLFIKVHISINSRWYICHLDMAPGYVGLWNPPKSSHELEVNSIFSIASPMVLSYFSSAFFHPRSY